MDRYRHKWLVLACTSIYGTAHTQSLLDFVTQLSFTIQWTFWMYLASDVGQSMGKLPSSQYTFLSLFCLFGLINIRNLMMFWRVECYRFVVPVQAISILVLRCVFARRMTLLMSAGKDLYGNCNAASYATKAAGCTCCHLWTVEGNSRKLNFFWFNRHQDASREHFQSKTHISECIVFCNCFIKRFYYNF